MDSIKEQPWQNLLLRCKPDKAVIRLHNDGGTFLASVNIPSVMWPLNGPYEVFHKGNCQLIENEAVATIVDGIPYRIGHCYTNAENVTAALQASKYSAVQYCGWMFTGDSYPIHHSWTVLNGNHIIDLSDDFTVLHSNHAYFDGADEQKARELFIDFSKWIQQYPNSKRTMPFGIPSANLLYIGCPCSAKEGRSIYNNLVYYNPDHPCNERLVEGKNMTKMQMMLQDAGLMPK